MLHSHHIAFLSFFIFTSALSAAESPETENFDDAPTIEPLYLPRVPDEVRTFLESERKQQKKSFANIPDWHLKSLLDNAPTLLQGIISYFQSLTFHAYGLPETESISSFHRLILVGPPGTGKTTMAYAIADMLNYPATFILATSLLGHFRNQTSNNIEKVLRDLVNDGLPRVIIIDELHKLFEHHSNDQTDDSQSAAAFWLTIDKIEKHNPHVIIIGTANDVVKLPPEIKSRFSGKFIKMPSLDKNQKFKTFMMHINYDQSTILDDSVTNEFITKMLQQIPNCSLRDVQLIIDSAKMFYYSDHYYYEADFPIVLTRDHFQQAVKQLQEESKILQEKSSEKIYKIIKQWGVPIAVSLHVLLLIKETKNLLDNYHRYKIRHR